MSRSVGSRALAVASLAVGIAAGTAAVLSALGASSASLPTASAAAGVTQTVSFGGARVVVPSGYRVRALVKVLRDGTRGTFAVTASR